MSDELYEIRTSLLLGSYTHVISEAGNIKKSAYKPAAETANLLAERDAMVFKAHIGLGQYDIVIEDLATTTAPPLRGVKLLAQYLKADTAGSNTSEIVTAAKELLRSVDQLGPVEHAQVASTVATLLVHAGELESALKSVRHALNSSLVPQPLALELHGLAVDILLRIFRPDQAANEVKQMATLDDDATTTQLCSAWVSLALGGEKVNDALQVFDDLREKFGPTVLLLNGQALAHMALNRFDQAEKCLLEAMSKRSQDPETLINLIVCSQQLKKSAEMAHPNHPWVRTYVTMERKFDGLADQYGKR
eukprot:TRINITY_DN1499_c0_g1_i1.p1 TRINITY_DN1499_c0_g1~~TRINITY_DN1499_c0_g1_i1.p1  ORF type:complete len:314 (+),score=45.57 TRINITY_DN1499_c0_g1_i1:27-944(+)